MATRYTRLVHWLCRLVATVGVSLGALGSTQALAYDLQFNVITDVDPVPTLGVLEYTVQIENSGSSVANDVRTVFGIPAGASVEGGALALPSTANANCSTSGAFVVCNHGNMNGTGGGGGTPPISFTLRFRAPALLPAPPNVRLRGAIGRGAPPLGTAQADPLPLFAAGSAFWLGDTNENNNANPVPLQQTSLENNADLSVAIVPSADPVTSGARLTYTVLVTNNGPNSNPTNGVRVRSTLPAGASFVGGSASGAGWSFSGPSAGVLTATRGSNTLVVGASVSFTFEMDVTIASGTLTHNAEVDTDRAVNGALLDNIASNNTASLGTTVSASANLALNKALNGVSGPFSAGSSIAFRLSPRNLGQGSASAVVVRDVLPAGHTLQPSFPLPPATQAFGPYTCRTNDADEDDQDNADLGRAARSILRCTRATMAAGSTENIDFSVDTSTALNGSYTNTALVSASTPDPVAGNNSGSVTYTVLTDGADVQLVSYSKNPALVASAGGTIGHSVRVRNNGPRAVEANLQAFVALAAGETLASTSTGWSCAAEAGGARCTYTGSYPVALGATSGSGGFVDLSFTTTANAVGTLTSGACVGGSGGSAEPTVTGFTPGSTSDFVTGNDCSGSRSVRATDQRSDLTVSKLTETPAGADKVVGLTETHMLYTLVVGNSGPDATGGVVLDDAIPGHINGQTVVSICGYVGVGTCGPPATANLPATIGAFTCSLSAGTVTCRSNDNLMGVGAANAATFVIRVGRPVRDSLSQSAVGGCSSAGQFCNQAGVAVDVTRATASLETDTGNNQARDAVEVHALANLQTTSKTFAPAVAQVGVDLTYTVNYRNPATSGSDLPAAGSPPLGQPAGVVFTDTFTLAANDPGFVLRSATIVAGAACTVTGTTGGVVSAPAAGGTSYSTGGTGGTVTIECPRVTMARNQDRQVSIVVRPNWGASGPLSNEAGFRIVDTGNTTVAANGATFDYNSDSSAADDVRQATANFALGQIDLRVENADLLDPIGWDPAAVSTSPGTNDIVYRVQVRNAGPSVATSTVLDYTITPPSGATVRFIGDEAGTTATMTSGATAPTLCGVTAGTNPVVHPATLSLRCNVPGFGFVPNVTGVVATGTGTTDGGFLNLRFRFESAPAPSGATVGTNAVVSAAETEAEGSNNAEPEITTVRTRADLAVSKTGFTAAVPALPAPLPPAVAVVNLRQPFNWVVEVVNNGPGDSLSRDRSGTSPLNGTGTVITDTLPAGVTVNGAITWEKTGTSSFPGAVTTGNGTCTRVAQVVTCNVGDVGALGRVRVSLPVRWDSWPGGAGNISTLQTNAAGVGSEQFDPGTGNDTTTHAVQVTRSSLAGLVFEDRERAGANLGTPQDAGAEPRLAGVQIVLRSPSGSDAHNNVFAPQSVNTLADGSYSFGDLSAGVYEIVQAQPAGFGNSPGDPTAAAPGSSPSLASTYVPFGAIPAGAPLPAGANSRYTGINLLAQQDGVRLNFPEVTRSSLRGFVYVDRNFSDQYEVGVDIPIANATVLVRNAADLNGAPLSSTTTAADGSYSFIDLDPALTYVLEQPLPSHPVNLGNRPSAVNVGRVGGVLTGTAAPNQPIANTDRITAISLAGGDGVQYNFGESPLAPITGRVYLDRNDNGSQGSNEPGLEGVTLGLYVIGTVCPASGALPTGALLSTITAASGDYSFGLQRQGSGYVICQVQPVGYGDRPAQPGSGGNSPRANQIDINSLNAGGANGQNFREVLAVLSGQVFVDYSSAAGATNNGLRDAGESGLGSAVAGAGVPITLTGTASEGLTAGVPLSITTHTDADGRYRFDDLFAGTYNLSQGAIPVALGAVVDGINSAGPVTAGTPGTAGAVGDNQIRNIQLAAGAQSPDNNFAELVPAGGISGTVYIDRNRDGALSAADPGRIPGVVVRLVEGTRCDGTELARVATDSQGNFSFSNASLTPPRLLAVGRSYSLCETQPGAYGEGAVNPGATATTPGLNHILIGSLLPSGSDNNLFGEQAGVIAGRVFLDAANDGGFNGSDSGLAGVTVTLNGGNQLPAGTAQQTQPDGSFRFEDLPAGVYALTEQAAQPVSNGSSTLNGQTRAGPAGGSATEITVLPSQVSGINLLPGATAPENLFAELLPVSISGRVWLDANDNAVIEGNEVGIPSVVIELSGTDSSGQAVSASTATDTSGRWAFTALRPGTYTVTEPAQPVSNGLTTLNGHTVPGAIGGGTATPLAVTPSRISGIALPTPGMASTDNHFGEIAPAQISGSVYNDVNNDGARQGGEEGYAGQTLNLNGTDDQGRSVSASTQTDANGDFRFTDLRPGVYAVTEPAQPPGTINGITTPGLGGGTATGTRELPSRISNITLALGQHAERQWFGEIGNSADLVVTKRLATPVFTEQLSGRYVLSVRNAGQLPTSAAYTVTDTLPAGMTVVAGSTSVPNPAGAGWACTVNAQTVSCTSDEVIAPGAAHRSEITLDVQVGSALCSAGSYPCTRDNRVWVQGGGELEPRQPTPAQRDNPPLCSDTATQNSCRLPTPIQQPGGVSGKVWLDADKDRRYQSGRDLRQSGFIVELHLGGALLRSTTTDAQGEYRFLGLVPGDGYEIRFRDAVSGAYYGRPVSADPAGGNDPQASGPTGVVPTGAIRGFMVPSGNGIRTQQNLPLDPSGVVYDSQTRQPVAGAVVELLGPTGALVPAACVLGGVNRITTTAQVTGSVPGGYAFWLLAPPAPGCPGDGDYQIRVTPPDGYMNAGVPSDGSATATSIFIPAQPGSVRVPAQCQAYVQGGACAIQAQDTAPSGSQPTPYFFAVPLTPNTPARFVDIINNHIPLDPFGGTRFVLSKQASRASAEVGDTVTYTLTVRHLDGPPLPNVRVDDRLPAGFRYIGGTFRIGGVVQSDPIGQPGPNLGFAVGTLPVNGQISFSYILRVGVGAQQGDGINTAQAVSTSGSRSVRSNTATARVRVSGGVFGNEACVTGKVYVDCNHNQVQDAEELGIPGVRLYLLDGTRLTSDVEGKYSYCGLPPRTNVLKVDRLTLPRGARLVTSSNRNAGDANSIFVDPKNGELVRSDFIEGSCSNRVLEQVKARRSQGEVRAAETENPNGPALTLDGKAPAYPQQGTDSANQSPVRLRQQGGRP